MVSGLIAVFLLPHIGQNTIDEEDIKFKEYLRSQGYDVSRMGLATDSTENMVESGSGDEKVMQDKIA